MTALLGWLWANTAGNLASSVVAAVVVYAWKIRPHLHAQAEHRRDVEDWFAQIHERLDALRQPGGDAASTDQGGRHGVTGQTGYIPPVTLSAEQVADLRAQFEAAASQPPRSRVLDLVEPYAPITGLMS